MKNNAVVVEQTYHAPVAKVWKAITDRNQMKNWYFDLPAFKAEPGFEFSFYGEDKEANKFLHLCKLTEVVKEKKLTYSWRYEGFEGNSYVSFELFPEGENTKIVLTHIGLESFPAAQAAFAKENFVDGWTHIIGKSLKEFVEKE